MANVNLTTEDYPGAYNIVPNTLPGGIVAVSRTFDCSSLNLLAANTYHIFTVGANIIPKKFYTSVTTAEGSAATLDIGDTDLITRFETNADMNATGVTPALDATIEYTAEKEIRIQPSANLSTAVFSIAMEFLVLDKEFTT